MLPPSRKKVKPPVVAQLEKPDLATNAGRREYNRLDYMKRKAAGNDASVPKRSYNRKRFPKRGPGELGSTEECDPDNVNQSD